jgi:hypothetical protein
MYGDGSDIFDKKKTIGLRGTKRPTRISGYELIEVIRKRTAYR